MLNKSEILEEVRDFLVPQESIDSIANKFKIELEDRLANSFNSMLPTFFRTNSNTAEKNSAVQSNNLNCAETISSIILAIDFGGTNLRFALFTTKPTYNIKYIKTITIENRLVNKCFFENIVSNIINNLADEFLKLNFKNLTVPVSITFSFPLDTENKITVMGKNFIVSNEIKDIPIDILLQEVFDNLTQNTILSNRRINFKINANILNDSIAVHLTNEYLIQGSQLTPNNNDTNSEIDMATMSLILGTGLNVCFELPYGKLPYFKQSSINKNNHTNQPSSMDKIIINSELGFLGNNIIQLSPFDIINELTMPMPLENISSGNYLPKILKKILNYYNIYPELTIQFDGEMFINLLEGKDLKLVIDHIDLNFLCSLSKIIVERSSIYLVSAIKAINMLINENNNNSNNNNLTDNNLNIGYVGSFLAHSPIYQEQIIDKSNGNINLVFLKDSSLIGAAIAI